MHTALSQAWATTESLCEETAVMNLLIFDNDYLKITDGFACPILIRALYSTTYVFVYQLIHTQQE